MAHELFSDIASLEERIHSCREEQLALYKRLLELSHAQRGAIARGDTDALLWATEEKGRLIERIDAIDIRLAGLIDDASILAGKEGLSHLCPYKEPGIDSACPLNVEIAQIIKTILKTDRENQALLEEAIGAAGDEIKQLDSGGKAVKAYWRRSPESPAGNVDDAF
ncbi:MAG: flagellar protein FlgN [Bacillota bacterium]